MEFNQNLQNRRKALGLTQAELGKKLNLAESTISLYESGKRFPDLETLKNLSKALQMPISLLMGENVKGVKIPVLGTVPAGIPLDAITEILDYEEISPSLANTGDFFALKIKKNNV